MNRLQQRISVKRRLILSQREHPTSASKAQEPLTRVRTRMAHVCPLPEERFTADWCPLRATLRSRPRVHRTPWRVIANPGSCPARHPCRRRQREAAGAYAQSAWWVRPIQRTVGGSDVTGDAYSGSRTLLPDRPVLRVRRRPSMRSSARAIALSRWPLP